MITKKNLWFLTLFSIILVMAVYYVSTPMDDASLVNKSLEPSSGEKADIVESSSINALRVSRDEALAKEVSGIKEILTDVSKTSDEKSDAYEALKELNNNKGKEDALEAIIKKNFNYDSFVKIDGTNVKVVIDTNSHSYDLANKIIRSVQEQFDKKVYITVNFGAK